MVSIRGFFKSPNTVSANTSSKMSEDIHFNAALVNAKSFATGLLQAQKYDDSKSAKKKVMEKIYEAFPMTSTKQTKKLKSEIEKTIAKEYKSVLKNFKDADIQNRKPAAANNGNLKAVSQTTQRSTSVLTPATNNISRTVVKKQPSQPTKTTHNHTNNIPIGFKDVKRPPPEPTRSTSLKTYETPPPLPARVPITSNRTPPSLPPKSPRTSSGTPPSLPPKSPRTSSGTPSRVPPKSPRTSSGTPPPLPPRRYSQDEI